MRKLILSMLLALVTGVAAAQTDFRQISYQEALAAAKEEGKLVYLTFHTEGCGPCKAMMRDVYPQKEVGDFMNEHFVSLEIDAEKGEGVELNKKFNVRAYPTCLIVRPDGSVQHRMVGGGSDWKWFLKRVEKGLDKKTSLLYLEGRYESGKITKKELVAYYGALRDAYCPEKAQKVHDEIMPQLTEKDKLKADYWPWLENTSRPGSADFDLILANLPTFEKNIGKEKLDEFLYNAYTYWLTQYIYQLAPEDAPTLAVLKQGIEKINIEQEQELRSTYELADISLAKDPARFVVYYEKKAKEGKEEDVFKFNRSYSQVKGFSKADYKRLLVVIDKLSAQASGMDKDIWKMMSDECKKHIGEE